MHQFRDFTPSRSNITRTVSSHRDHKEDLIRDFQNRCGYCNTIDTWRIAWYEVDHFVPKKHLVTISDTDYSNLVYSCRSCNNAKRAQWPTESETTHNNGIEGFIDPCSSEYGKLFYRNYDGTINTNNTILAKWIYNALKLYKSIHSITWNIEQTSNEIDEIKKLIKQQGGIQQVLSKNPNIVVKVYNLFDKYQEYTKSLTKH